MPQRSNTRITDKTVRRKPTNKPFEVRDCDLRGFILRVQPSGTKTFYAEWARGKRSRIGDANVMTVERARELARTQIANAKKGEVPEPQMRSRVPTLEDFLNKHYLDWATENQKSGATNTRRLLSSFSEMTDTRIDRITAWQVDKWKTNRKKSGTAPATINRDVLMLKAALNKAVEWKLMESNPVASVKPLKGANQKRVRYLSPDEEKRLFKTLKDREEEIRSKRQSANTWRSERNLGCLPEIPKNQFADHLLPMVLISIHTGLRFGELTSLTWNDVLLTDLPYLTVQAAYSKSHKTRHVPLNETGTNALKKWRYQSNDVTGLVFPSPTGGKLGSVKTAWLKALKKAKISDFKWHDLRHHFASKLVMAGVDLNTVRELLGHSSIDMTLRYAHLAPEHKATAVALLDS
jgi:integrase